MLHTILLQSLVSTKIILDFFNAEELTEYVDRKEDSDGAFHTTRLPFPSHDEVLFTRLLIALFCDHLFVIPTVYGIKVEHLDIYVSYNHH